MNSANAVGRADWHGRAPRIAVYLQIAADRVERAQFHAAGCGAAIASGSVLTELVENQTTAACANISATDVDRALGGLPISKRHCAEVAVQALRMAILEHGRSDSGGERVG